MHLSKFSETIDLHTSLYNSLIAEAGRTAIISPVIYLNTHGAKNPGPCPPWHMLAANSCRILLILPLIDTTILNIPQNGS